MAVLTVRVWPDPALKEVARPIEKVDDEVRALISDMFETMYHENGVGLAANQVGVTRRVIVIDLDPKGEAKNNPDMAEDLAAWGFKEPFALINPQITSAEGTIVWEEGCLSVPGITEPVKRKERVVVRALDRNGVSFEVHATGLLAVALQHEIDHLDGRVFVEYLSKLKRDVIKRKMLRLKAESEAERSEEKVAVL